MKPLRIMVVDDSLLTIKKLSAMLETLGHQVVHTARSGVTICEDYATHQPDIVTMDITMPEVNGIEATRTLVAKYPGALVIMVTSHGQEQMVLDAVKAGAKAYVLKPFKKERLEESLTQVMEHHGHQTDAD